MLPILNYPQIVVEGLVPYHDLFQPHELDRCQRYLTGLMVCDNKTIEGINRQFADPLRIDQSTLNRFLTDGAWDAKGLNDRRIALLQNDAATRTGWKHSVCALDDTLLRKYGTHTPGVGVFFDHKTKGYIRAHNLVTSQYVDRKTTYPIDLRLYQKYPKLEKKRLQAQAATFDRTDRNTLTHHLTALLAFRAKEQAFKDKQMLFRELVTDFVERGLACEAVAFDNWFFNKTNTDHVQSYQRHWLTRTKSNTRVLHRGRRTPIEAWGRQVVAEHRDLFQPYTVTSKEGKKATFWCLAANKKISCLGRQKCRIVVSFDNPALTGDPTFIITDYMRWNIQHILDLYALRWPIETFYRDGKVHLGLEDYQLRNTQGTERHWYLVFLLDTLLAAKARASALPQYVQGRVRTVGEQCRAAVEELLKSLICWLYRELPKYASANEVYAALMG